jgi:hypothetical protein
VLGDLRIEELAPQRSETFEGAALIGGAGAGGCCGQAPRDAAHFRNSKHRELLLSGLRLAAGKAE